MSDSELTLEKGTAIWWSWINLEKGWDLFDNFIEDDANEYSYDSPEYQEATSVDPHQELRTVSSDMKNKAVYITFDEVEQEFKHQLSFKQSINGN